MLKRNNDSPVSIRELNEKIKQMFEIHFFSVVVVGEISNFVHHNSGHMYFSLKDSDSSIKTVMFSSQNRNLIFSPENGMKVIVTGRVSVYPQRGEYQIYAESMKLDGEGDLHIKFELLKKKLKAEGLFDLSHKKRLPRFPKIIGIVTSSTTAALRDIVNVLKKRYFDFRIILRDTLVQGAQAQFDIEKAVLEMNQYSKYVEKIDILIIARGGGSIEDLWPFNEERVARAVFNSDIPIISGVGHQVDFTICDFVADHRSATPSAGAEDAVPDKDELRQKLEMIESNLRNSLKKKEEQARLKLERFNIESLSRILKQKWMNSTQQVDEIVLYRLRKNIESILNIKSKNVDALTEKLKVLSPLKILERGYSQIVDENGKVINSIKQTESGKIIRMLVTDGRIDARITDIQEKSHEKENI